jgi:hypothetical protein
MTHHSKWMQMGHAFESGAKKTNVTLSIMRRQEQLDNKLLSGA